MGSALCQPTLCRHCQQLECPKEISKTNGISTLEDGDNTFIGKVGIRLLSDAASHPRTNEIHDVKL
jgi:hypothetical protein